MVLTMKKLSDAEKNNSSQMNSAAAAAAYRNEGGVRVVFIGNSITLHLPAPQIGWSGNHGMAASAPEKDYVHLVISRIEAETGRKADVLIRNLADFERGFQNYNFDEIQDLADFDPDYLIVALGENVAELSSQEERFAFREAFKKLLGVFVRNRSIPAAVVRGVFWHNAWKDEMMEHAASDFSIPFVKADLGGDESMKAGGLFEHTGVQSHPGDKGMAEIARVISEALFPADSIYKVRVDGKPVPVRPIRISAMPFNQWGADYQRPMDQTEIAGMINLEADGEIQLHVDVSKEFKEAVIRPLKSAVEPVVNGSSVDFSLPGPGYYVLELDGYHNPLEIFVEPVRDFAKEIAEANIIFGPGRHEPVVVKLKSHDRVYIDRDALVVGSFQIDGAEDVRVSGYGIICGSRNFRRGLDCYRDGMDGAVRIIDSGNIVFDGPVILDSACWCVSAFNSANLEFAHLKITGAWRYNTDGIDICNSQHVRIHDCFIHSFDDTVVLKGIPFSPDCLNPVSDVLVERCVCWCGWGRTLEVGLETWASCFRGIVFEDCDLIHNNAAAISIHLGGPGLVEDVTCRNIRIEYDASEMSNQNQKGERDRKANCKSPYSGCWLSVSNAKMYSSASYYEGYDASGEPFGTFKKLTIENIFITVGKGAMQPAYYVSAEPGTVFGEISISGVRICSKGDTQKEIENQH